MNWDWLKENGEYVIESGEWKYGESGSFDFRYFNLTDNT